MLQRSEEFSIRLSGERGELMNSRVHGSEELLAELPMAKLSGALAGARVLIGGLGMGFTLAKVLALVAVAGLIVLKNSPCARPIASH